MTEECPRVYLDVSALCRPFDNQNAIRIRLETEAVNLILEKVREGRLQLVVSPTHRVEISAYVRGEEREQVLALLASSGFRPDFDLVSCRKRAEEFSAKSLGLADAAHLSFAVEAGASFVTCDDRLVKRADRIALPVWVGTPNAFCEKENLR